MGGERRMAPPYRVGDRAVWLEPDPDGLRVHRTTVIAIEPDPEGWQVETTHGVEHVDGRGEGGALVPADEELAVALDNRGDGFLVESTTRQLEAQLDPSTDWESFETPWPYRRPPRRMRIRAGPAVLV